MLPRGLIDEYVMGVSKGRCYIPRGLHCSGEFLTLSKQQMLYDMFYPGKPNLLYRVRNLER